MQVYHIFAEIFYYRVGFYFNSDNKWGKNYNHPVLYIYIYYVYTNRVEEINDKMGFKTELERYTLVIYSRRKHYWCPQNAK